MAAPSIIVSNFFSDQGKIYVDEQETSVFWWSDLLSGRGRRKVIDYEIRPCIADQVKIFIIIHDSSKILFYVSAVTEDNDIFHCFEF